MVIVSLLFGQSEMPINKSNEKNVFSKFNKKKALILYVYDLLSVVYVRFFNFLSNTSTYFKNKTKNIIIYVWEMGVELCKKFVHGTHDK